MSEFGPGGVYDEAYQDAQLRRNGATYAQVVEIRVAAGVKRKEARLRCVIDSDGEGPRMLRDPQGRLLVRDPQRTTPSSGIFGPISEPLFMLTDEVRPEEPAADPTAAAGTGAWQQSKDGTLPDLAELESEVHARLRLRKQQLGLHRPTTKGARR